MDTLVQNLQTFILVGIIVVVAVAQVHRPLGAALAVIFCISLAIVGSIAMDRGAHLGILGIEFSKPGLYAFCTILAIMNLIPVYVKAKKKPRYDHSDDD